MRSPRNSARSVLYLLIANGKLKLSDELVHQHATVLTSNIEVFVVARR